MELRITHTTQGVSEPLPLEWTIDAIELTDEDLKKVTGTWGRFGGFGFHPFPSRRFNNNVALAINNVAIAGNRSVALNTVAIAIS